MISTRHGNEIHISESVTRALDGVQSGYRVTLHALPQFVFLVDAPDADTAQRLAFAVAKERGDVLTDAATIVRIA